MHFSRIKPSQQTIMESSNSMLRIPDLAEGFTNPSDATMPLRDAFCDFAYRYDTIPQKHPTDSPYIPFLAFVSR